MTTANKITILRILLVPLFIVELLYYVQSGYEGHRYIALACFAAAAISDGIDGYIARKYNQRSVLGAVLDPLADKLLLVSGIVLLSLNNGEFLPRIPLWLTVTILSRDLMLLIGLALLHYLGSKIVVRPVFVGKMATVFQMTCVLWGLFKWPENWLMVWSVAAAVCTAISGVIYVISGVALLNASPSSAASPKEQ